ncbi:hypothetical protein JXD38_00295 [candidate division WOR-3 bacterium]|nr:hypothetical protein [candidate division WOR-3 bacterium]
MKSMFLVLVFTSFFASAAEHAVVDKRSTAAHGRQAAAQSVESIVIPQMLSYQGKLTDTLGVPVSDTSYQVTFRFYTAPTGGTSFWSETQTVQTQGGLFSVLLGSVAQIESVPSSGSLYLGMAVAGGTELSPRLRLVGSTYSYLAARSANADLLQGKDTTALDAHYVNEGQTNSVTSAMLVDGTIAAADLGQMGAATGQVMKWTGSAWTPRNDSVSSGGSGTVRKVVQSTGVVCSPNPISDSGTVSFDSSYGDSRYIKNQFASNQFASWRIAGQGSCSANSAGDAALKGTNASITGYGVWGSSSDHYGVYGSTVSGRGVCGNSSASGSGVYGLANSGPGVYGSSGSNYGVVGNSSSGVGVYGGSSGGYGVHGMSTGSCGVAGQSTNNDGVYGTSSAPGNAGVHGKSTAIGGGYGVWGEDSLGHGVYGVSYDSSGVYGKSSTGSGVVGRSASSVGVTGISMSSYGAYDSSSNSTGVYGVSAGASQSGVVGMSHGSGGTGVLGHANGGGTCTGARGLADGSLVNYAVRGDASGGSSNYGVRGNASGGNSYGLYGEATGLGSNYGVYGTASGGASNYAGYFSGDVTVTGNLSKGGGSFQIDHPLDPLNKYLLHSFVESPDMMNIYNGNVKTDTAGYATVTLPNWFETLNGDFRYQLTVIDESDGGRFAQAKVVRGIKGNSFIVRTSVPSTTVSWQVTGIRQDPYATVHRVQVEVAKLAGERGRYLHPEAYGKPSEAGIAYVAEPDSQHACAVERPRQ